MKHIPIPLILGFIFLVSCKPKDAFLIKDFDPFTNFTKTSDTLLLPMDLSEAVMEGVVLPSKKQSPSGYFKISFQIINNTGKPRAYYYKLFYQNETYKFIETQKVNDTLTVYNESSGNNFYGSWENANDGFHITPEIPNDNQYHVVTDSFRIAGNPRDEEKYFGAEKQNIRLSDKLIKETTEKIKNTPEWLSQVKKKATENNVTLDEQIFQDVLWIVNDVSGQGKLNNRWKRNPRVGCYSFLLALSADSLENVPETIKNIGKQENERFVNPYYELFYNSELQKKCRLTIVKSKQVLKTFAEFDPGSGIYINEMKLRNPSLSLDTSYYSKSCGSDFNVFSTAQFEQYFHNISKKNEFYNIPEAYDVTGDNYTQDAYNKNVSKYPQNKLKPDFFKISDSPGRTVSSDTALHLLTFMNPGNKNNNLRKENVGITSRIGFTYGKFIARIKFPAIINKENVWNGLTCAYWLKFQDEKNWNYRTVCEGEGYLEKTSGGADAPRLKTTYYSEIDFEILKTSNFWPQTSYPVNTPVPQDDPKSNRDIMVTCTNWDMACRTPENFSVGARDFFNETKHYTVHRWDDWYKALTIKSPVNHDSIFNRPYYYEIDWQPDKITWRIGADRNNMTEIGYMDYTITSVPDNQMVMVFSQEFHDSKWWPLSPFIQEMIPYPGNDIIGQVLEVRVE